MKRAILSAIFVTVLICAGSAPAAIYEYEDADGTRHYTNELSEVPPDDLNQVTESEETPSSAVEQPSRKDSAPVTYPLLENMPTAEQLKKEREQKKQREQLEAEYAELLKEKETLDNDKSFQTRRYKRKYQNRPYIKEMVAREAEIKQRLGELEKMLGKKSE